MKKEFTLKKCVNCGAIVSVMQDCTCENCGITCCGEEMTTVIANSVDAVAEKHVPTYEVSGNDVVVTVNHVMEENHYIEWIGFVSDEKEEFYHLKPGMRTTVTFKDVNSGTLYAYCNLHGLWKNEIKL